MRVLPVRIPPKLIHFPEHYFTVIPMESQETQNQAVKNWVVWAYPILGHIIVRPIWPE